MPDDRDARRKARANWPIRRALLSDEQDDDLSSSTTAEQRLNMMWRLALDAWASMGQKIPDYDRAHTPGRVIRRS